MIFFFLGELVKQTSTTLLKDDKQRILLKISYIQSIRNVASRSFIRTISKILVRGDVLDVSWISGNSSQW